MKLAAERFDGSRVIKEMPYVGEDSTVILVPRRNLLTGEVEDYMRFDKTKETHEGLSLFRQSALSLVVKFDGVEETTIVPQQP